MAHSGSLKYVQVGVLGAFTLAGVAGMISGMQHDANQHAKEIESLAMWSSNEIHSTANTFAPQFQEQLPNLARQIAVGEDSLRLIFEDAEKGQFFHVQTTPVPGKPAAETNAPECYALVIDDMEVVQRAKNGGSSVRNATNVEKLTFQQVVEGRTHKDQPVVCRGQLVSPWFVNAPSLKK